MNEHYWMAADCPNCGEKDEMWQYKGARQSNSDWGHPYSCCSDKCGREFATSIKRKQMELESTKLELAQLKSRVARLEKEIREIEEACR